MSFNRSSKGQVPLGLQTPVPGVSLPPTRGIDMLRYAVECSFLFVGALLRGRAAEFIIFSLWALLTGESGREAQLSSEFFVLRELLKKTGNLVD